MTIDLDKLEALHREARTNFTTDTVQALADAAIGSLPALLQAARELPALKHSYDRADEELIAVIAERDAARAEVAQLREQFERGAQMFDKQEAMLAFFTENAKRALAGAERMPSFIRELIIVDGLRELVDGLSGAKLEPVIKRFSWQEGEPLAVEMKASWALRFLSFSMTRLFRRADGSSWNFITQECSDEFGEFVITIQRKGAETVEAKWKQAIAELAELRARLTEVDGERETLHAECERLRGVFDLTRHRICDRLGVDRGTGWFNVENSIAQLRAGLAAVTAERNELSRLWEAENQARGLMEGLCNDLRAERDSLAAEIARRNANWDRQRVRQKKNQREREKRKQAARDEHRRNWKALREQRDGARVEANKLWHRAHNFEEMARKFAGEAKDLRTRLTEVERERRIAEVQRDASYTKGREDERSAFEAIAADARTVCEYVIAWNSGTVAELAARRVLEKFGGGK